MSKPTFLRNAWYVAAWSNEIGRSLLDRTILGESICLYRKENGDAAAIGNVCPHRFAPLSMGKLIGDVVQCGYHGLRFDAAGKCVKIPHDENAKIPAKMCVRHYPLVERHGMVWLWMGEPAKADAATIPDFSCQTDESLAFVGGMFEIKAHYELVTDNLLDLTHAEFVHEGILSSEAITKSKLQTVQNGTTVYSNRWAPNGTPPPAWGVIFDNCTDPVDHWVYMRWDAPAHMLLDVGICPVGGKRDDGVWVYGTDIITPKDETSSYYFWGVSRGYKINDPAAGEFWREAIKAAFEGQDEPMIEAQQRMLGTRTLEEAGPVLFDADAAAMRARRVLAQLIAEEANGKLPQPVNPLLSELRHKHRETRSPVGVAV